MVKYLIEVNHEEMWKDDYKRYGTVYEKYNYSTNQTPDDTYEYDTEEEARKAFGEMEPTFLPEYGGVWGNHYDFCEVILLKIVEYDDEGNWVDEDGIDFKYADRTTECVSNDEDEEEEDEE